jgi:predicted HTH domain antitoxin
LPEDLVKALRRIEEIEQSDRSTTVRKLLSRAVAEWRRDYAARLYGERKVTLERAASEAGVSVREMMEYLRAKKVPGQYELSDLEEDMTRFICDFPKPFPHLAG